MGFAMLNPSYDLHPGGHRIRRTNAGSDVMNSLRGNQGPRYRHTAGDGEPYETVGVNKLTPIIGAEISRINLAHPLSNRQFDKIHRALAENLVIFFRDQSVGRISVA